MSDFLNFDLSEIHMTAASIGANAKQVPYAAARSLNNAAFKAREHLAGDTWPRSVTVRNRGFIKQALRVEKATKTKLQAAVVDTMGRGNLLAHADGGTKVAKKRNLAIPTSAVKLTSKGVRDAQKPANLKRAFVRNGTLFQVVGKGKGSRLQALFTLRPQAKIRKSVPFREEFADIVTNELRRSVPKELVKAMLGKFGKFVK